MADGDFGDPAKWQLATSVLLFVGLLVLIPGQLDAHWLFLWAIALAIAAYGAGASTRISSRDNSAHATAPGYMEFETHFRRLYQIEKTLGEIGAVFDDATSAQENDDLRGIATILDRTLVPGFVAYHLAQEGLSLLKVIAACRAAGTSKALETILSHAEKAELLLHKTAQDMEPYKFMDARKTVEAFAARLEGHPGSR